MSIEWIRALQGNLFARMTGLAGPGQAPGAGPGFVTPPGPARLPGFVGADRWDSGPEGTVRALRQQIEAHSLRGGVARVGGVRTSAPVAAPPTTPSQQADQVIAAERARTEREKYTFSPELQKKADAWNEKVDEHNRKIERKASKVERELAEVQSDPNLSTEERAKKTKELRKKLRKIRKELKPRLDLATLTREVDQVMNDPNLCEDQKKEEVEKIRKKYGLPKKANPFNGGIGMNNLVTDRLGEIYERSEKRLDEAADKHKSQLKRQLRDIERTCGKNSPQAIRMRAELKAVDQKYDKEQDRLKNLADAYKDLYPGFNLFRAIGKFFEAIGKVLDFLMPLVKLIPGIGQIAGAVWGGIKAVGSIVSGNVMGAFSALAGVVPVVGDAIGAVGGAVSSAVDSVVGGVKSALGSAWGTIEKAVGYVDRGVRFATSVARGDVVGAVGSAAGIAGAAELDGVLPEGVGQVARHATRATRAGERFAAGDIAGGLSGAAGVASSAFGVDVAAAIPGPLVDAAQHGARAVQAGAAFARNDVAAGLSASIGYVDGALVRSWVPAVPESLREATPYLSEAAQVGTHFARGDVAGGVAHGLRVSGAADWARGQVSAAAAGLELPPAWSHGLKSVERLPEPWHGTHHVPVPFQASLDLGFVPPLIGTAGESADALTQRLFAELYGAGPRPS